MGSGASQSSDSKNTTSSSQDMRRNMSKSKSGSQYAVDPSNKSGGDELSNRSMQAPASASNPNTSSVASSHTQGNRTSKSSTNSNPANKTNKFSTKQSELQTISAMDSFRRKRLHTNNDSDEDEVQIQQNTVETASGMVIEARTKTMLTAALSEALHLDRSLSTFNLLMDTLLRCLEFRQYPKGELIIDRGGDKLKKMFIVESGSIQVIDVEEEMMFVGAGKCVGVLSCLFEHAPQFTAFAHTQTNVWVLNRSDFVKIQKRASVESHMHRVLRLSNVSLLAQILSGEQISELAANLSKDIFAPSHPLFKKDTLVDRIMLVEKGSVSLTVPQEYADFSDGELCTSLGVTAPPLDPNESFKAEINLIKFNRERLTEPNGDSYQKVTLGEGSVIGLNILLGKANRVHGWPYLFGQVSEDGKVVENRGTGCKSPLDITAVSSVSVSCISIKKFERLFGDVAELFASAGYGDATATAPTTPHTVTPGGGTQQPRKGSIGGISSTYAPVSLNVDSFETVELLNHIHMGFGAIGHAYAPAGPGSQNSEGADTTMNTTVSDKSSSAVTAQSSQHSHHSSIPPLPQTHKQSNANSGARGRKYFLKILSKQAVSNEGQRKHVLSEASILATVSHPFIVHLYDRFQTSNELVFAFEFLPGGDLFHLLYGHIPRIRHELSTPDLKDPASRSNSEPREAATANGPLVSTRSGKMSRSPTHEELNEAVNNVIKLSTQSSRALNNNYGETSISGNVLMSARTPTPMQTQRGGVWDGLSVEAVRFYAASLVCVLGHLRSQSIAFRNLKPENIMLDAQGYIKLVGFGISKKIPYKSVDSKLSSAKYNYKTYTLCGTLEYMAPEMLFSRGHDHNVDKWALGVCIYELLTGTTPFRAETQALVATNITKVLTRIDASHSNMTVDMSDCLFPQCGNHPNMGPVERNFIERLMQPEPTNRMSLRYNDMSGAYGHDMFVKGKFDWEALQKRTMPAPVDPLTFTHESLHNLQTPRTARGSAHANVLLSGIADMEEFTGPKDLFKHF